MPVVPRDYLASLAATEVLDRYLPLDETGLFVKDIKRWPRVLLRPLLVFYERICSRTVEFIWHRSLLQWLIKT